jgi:hypothetical protein
MVMFCCLAGSSKQGFSVENPLLARQKNNLEKLFKPASALLNPKNRLCLRLKLFIHAGAYGAGYVALASVWYLLIATGFDLSKWRSEDVNPYTIPIMAALSTLVAIVMFYFEWQRLNHSLALVQQYLAIQLSVTTYIGELKKSDGSVNHKQAKTELEVGIISLARLARERKSDRKWCVEPLHLLKFMPFYTIQTFTLNVMLKCFLVMIYDDSIVDGGVDPTRLFSTLFDKTSFIGCGLTAAVYGAIRVDDNTYTLSDREVVGRLKPVMSSLTLFERSNEGVLNNCESGKSNADGAGAAKKLDGNNKTLLEKVFKMEFK